MESVAMPCLICRPPAQRHLPHLRARQRRTKGGKYVALRGAPVGHVGRQQGRPTVTSSSCPRPPSAAYYAQSLNREAVRPV